MERLQSWLRSDLVGIPATLAAVALVALAFVLFAVAGSAAGLLVGLVAVASGLYLVVRASGDRREITDIAPPRVESAQRVLVVANGGLGSPALLDELRRRRRLGPLAVHVIVPVQASSARQAVADDIDAEAGRAQARLDAALRALADADIAAEGHIDDEASPMDSLLDGLREFAADDALLVPSSDLDWSEAEKLGEQVRERTGVGVVEIGP